MRNHKSNQPETTERDSRIEYARKRWILAAESSGIGIWDFNLLNNTLVGDEIAHRLFGNNGREVCESVDLILKKIHPEDYEKIRGELEKVKKGKYNLDTNVRILGSDGSIRFLKVNGVIEHDDQGRPAHLIGLSYDITELIQTVKEKDTLSTQLLQAQKMESMGRLAGGVAHDFNNMLSVILGYLDLATPCMGSECPLNYHLGQIRKAAERSTELTRQLLAYARKQPVLPKVLDLNGTIKGMLLLLKRIIGENIEVVWLPSRNLMPVKIDPSQIDQILTNLCVNARDAISANGKIVIETENNTLDEDYCSYHDGFVPGKYVSLTVSDNGCGMDKSVMNHLFEPFFTTKEPGKGTGLGLATVYGIVKQNKGFVNVYSEVGIGTIVRIYLPCSTEESGRIYREKPMEKVMRGTENILLVEDEPLNLNVVTTMLDHLGYNVLAAKTPDEALKMVQEHSCVFHLLVSDMIMPGMSGADLSKKLESLCPGMKSLFISGYTVNSMVHQGVFPNDVHFMQKPFSLQHLAAKVRAVLDDGKSVS